MNLDKDLKQAKKQKQMKESAIAQLRKRSKDSIETKSRKKYIIKRSKLTKNINARKKAGKSRPKSKSTISKKAYKNMRKGFPK